MRRHRTVVLVGLLLGAQILAGGLCDRGKTDLMPGTEVTGTISGPGDEIPFEVHLKGGHGYVFTLETEAGGDSSMFSPRLYIASKDSQKTLAETSGVMGGRLSLEYSPEKDVDVYVIVASNGGGFTFSLFMEEGGRGAVDAGRADSGRDAGRDAGKPKDASADADVEDAGEPEDAGGGDAGPDAGCAASCASGCCDVFDKCQTGDQDDRCGKGGAACEDCTTSTATCQLRQCVVCDSASCATGCCDTSGVCRLGNANDECGTDGAECVDCTSGGKTCDPTARDCR